MNNKKNKMLWVAAAALMLTASSSLAQIAPPFTQKFFNAATIGVGGTTSMDITINNIGPTTLSSVTFTDNLPAGLVVATPSGLLTACTPGSTLGAVTATAAGNIVSLGASTLVAGGACTVQVNVTGTAAGPVTNSVQPTDGIAGAGNLATANIRVLAIAPPTIAKVFGAPAITPGAITSLTFTVGALNALANVNFADTLPLGLTVAMPNALATTCTGVLTATAGSSQISLSGATFAAAGTCTVTVNVTGAVAGTFPNSVQATDINAGAGNVSNATLVVAAPPTITKAFADSQIQLLGPSSTTALSFTITNPAANPSLSGIAFTDTLPAGLIVATPANLIGTCGGGVISATAGLNTISLANATLAGGASCTFSVDVTATMIGVQVNTTSTITAMAGSLVGGTATATTAVNDLFFFWFFAESGGGNR